VIYNHDFRIKNHKFTTMTNPLITIYEYFFSRPDVMEIIDFPPQSRENCIVTDRRITRRLSKLLANRDQDMMSTAFFKWIGQKKEVKPQQSVECDHTYRTVVRGYDDVWRVCKKCLDDYPK